MDYDNYKKRRFRAEEREAVMELDALSRSLDGPVQRLEKRLSGLKYLKRDVGCVKRIIRKLHDEAIKEQPEDIKDILYRQSRDFVIRSVRVSVQPARDEVRMPLADEWQFIQIAIDSRCRICMNTPAECYQCKVRALLRRYVDGPTPVISGTCGYMGC